VGKTYEEAVMLEQGTFYGARSPALPRLHGAAAGARCQSMSLRRVQLARCTARPWNRKGSPRRSYGHNPITRTGAGLQLKVADGYLSLTRLCLPPWFWPVRFRKVSSRSHSNWPRQSFHRSRFSGSLISTVGFSVTNSSGTKATRMPHPAWTRSSRPKSSRDNSSLSI
jgi:hypothetical protein